MCKPSNPTFVSVQNPFGVDPANSLVNNVTNSEQQQSTQWKTGSSKSRKHHPHIFVEHHYHDHANDAEAMDDRPAKGGVTVPFPIRLHQMLDKMEADGRGDIISWQPHGRCFVVRKPKEFKELLPSYFKLSKMASFQRKSTQCTIWDGAFCSIVLTTRLSYECSHYDQPMKHRKHRPIESLRIPETNSGKG